MDPAPTGSLNGNVVFDSMANPVSVNAAFLDVCAGCPLGTGELQGTGFDVWNDAGATSFVIWDAGDQSYDSTVLLDGFRWRLAATEVETQP
jgi:hypothetical protein